MFTVWKFGAAQKPFDNGTNEKCTVKNKIDFLLFPIICTYQFQTTKNLFGQKEFRKLGALQSNKRKQFHNKKAFWQSQLFCNSHLGVGCFFFAVRCKKLAQSTPINFGKRRDNPSFKFVKKCRNSRACGGVLLDTFVGKI